VLAALSDSEPELDLDSTLAAFWWARSAQIAVAGSSLGFGETSVGFVLGGDGCVVGLPHSWLGLATVTVAFVAFFKFTLLRNLRAAQRSRSCRRFFCIRCSRFVRTTVHCSSWPSICKINPGTVTVAPHSRVFAPTRTPF
jgi:hypothetical protein